MNKNKKICIFYKKLIKVFALKIIIISLILYLKKELIKFIYKFYFLTISFEFELNYQILLLFILSLSSSIINIILNLLCFHII